MVRVYFKNKHKRILFFNEIKIASQNVSWQSIAESIQTNKSMIENYKSGKLSLPEERFNKLLILLPEEGKNYFMSQISKREDNWGRIIGGKNAYKINKKYFDLGRESLNKNRNSKYPINIDISLSSDLCLFIGAIIGDGFTNKYQNIYQTQITGDKLLDKDYYNSVLSPICKNIFKITPKISIRERGIYLNIYSKDLFNLLTKRFEIPPGIKSYSVKIPKEIFHGKETHLCATVRGMFDTDGGIGFDKRKSYKIPYIRINYTSASPKLIEQLSLILIKFEIPHSIHRHSNKTSQTQQIQINGLNNVKKFMNKIGFSNPRHINKLNNLIDK